MRLTGPLSGLGRGQGRHPQGRRHPHRQGRHRRDRRVLRSRRRVDLGHRQGDDLQHGRRDRRDVLAVPLRRPGGAVPARRPSARSSPTSPTAYAEHLRADPEVEADPERFYDRVDRDRPRRARAAPRRAAHPRPRPPDLRGQAAAVEEGYPLDISYALVGSCTNSSLRGHRAGRARRAPGQGRGPAREDAAADHARLRAGARDDRARRLARRPRGDRRDRARERVRAVHRAVAARRHPEGRAATRSSRRSTATSRPATTATPTTLSFIGSPETVTAMALDRPPRRRLRARADRRGRRRRAVARAARSPTSCPTQGFDPGESGFVAPAADGASVEIVVEPGSRAPRAARAVPGVGRPGPHRACACC